MLVLRGSLYKQGDSRIRWNQRAFILQPAQLIYFETDADADAHTQDPASKAPKGSMPLVGATITRARSSRAGEPTFTIESQAPKPARWTLTGATTEETMRWVAALAGLGVPNDWGVALPQRAPSSAASAPAPDTTPKEPSATSAVCLGALAHSAIDAAQTLVVRELGGLVQQPVLSFVLAFGVCWAWIRPGGAAWSETPRHPPPPNLGAVASAMSAIVAPGCWTQLREYLAIPALQRAANTPAALASGALQRMPRSWANREPISFAFGTCVASLLVVDVAAAAAKPLIGAGRLDGLLPDVLGALVATYVPYWCVVAAGQNLPIRVRCFRLLISPAACARVFAAAWCAAFSVAAALFPLGPAGRWAALLFAPLLVLMWVLFELVRATAFAAAAALACLSVLRLAADDDGAWFEWTPAPAAPRSRVRAELV